LLFCYSQFSILHFQFYLSQFSYKNKGVIKASTKAASKNSGNTNTNQNLKISFKCGISLFCFQFHIFLNIKTVILKAKATESKTALISKTQWGKSDNIVFKTPTFSILKGTTINIIITFQNITNNANNDIINQDNKTNKPTKALFLKIFHIKTKLFSEYTQSIVCLACSTNIFLTSSEIGTNTKNKIDKNKKIRAENM